MVCIARLFCMSLFAAPVLLNGCGGGSNSPDVAPSPGPVPSPIPPPPPPPCAPGIGDDEQSPCEGTGEGQCCTDSATCLKIVDDFMEKAVRQKIRGGRGLRQTYGPGDVGGGPCGDLCELGSNARFDVYDNSVAAIYLTLRGRLNEAAEVLDTFLGLLYPAAADSTVEVPSGRPFALLAAAYDISGNVNDAGIDTGNNAWVGLAFAHYAVAAKSSCHAMVARDMVAALDKTFACGDRYKGFFNRPEWGGRSIEHNIDMYALTKILGDEDGAARAQTLVRSLFYDSRDVYLAGTNNGHPSGPDDARACDMGLNTGPTPGDAQFWNYLAHVDEDPKRQTAAMRFVGCKSQANGGLWGRDEDLIGNAGVGAGTQLHGVRFSSAGRGLQWEVTAGAAMAMFKYGQESKERDAPNFTRQVIFAKDSMRWLLQTYKAVPATVLGGNYKAWNTNYGADPKYPGGTDTGVGWGYFRYPHLGATAWTGLLMLVMEEGFGNPFAAPKDPMPSSSATDNGCLPPIVPNGDASIEV